VAALANLSLNTKLYAPSRDIYFRQRLPLVSLQKLPLMSRGWIYQERRLSRRVLHFSFHEVHWECRHRRKSQPGEGYVKFKDDTRSWVTFPYMVRPYSKLEKDPIRLWHKTVYEYTGLQLSFKSDKLLALAALARKMEIMREDRYLAGLWKKSLLCDLGWLVTQNPSGGRSSTLGAPT
jgi:hypothetical protein